MKKRNFIKLAYLGVVSGLLISNHLQAASDVTNATESSQKDPSDGNLGYHLMTEKELLDELDDEGYKLYNTLDPESKALARKVASQRCAGSNICKGFNACKTEKHDCAGKGDCKGNSKCGFSDKNLAVKVVAEKMKQKRVQAGDQF